MTSLKEVLASAIENSQFTPEPEINSYIWKGPKVIDSEGNIHQEQIRLIDCSKEKLQEYLEHCKEMLNNRDNKNPGRYKVKDEVYQQINKCNAELFIREQIDKTVTRFNFLTMLRKYFSDSNISINDIKNLVLNDIVSGELSEYSNIPADVIMDTCLDKAGIFNKQHLTTTFILKQGLWLTPAEYKEHELFIKNKSKKDVEEYFKKILNINKKHNLRISSAGLTLAEMKEALGIRNTKYSLMGTDKLRILRDKLLFVLLKDIDNHIEQWQNLMYKIQLVLSYKYPNEPVSNV